LEVVVGERLDGRHGFALGLRRLRLALALGNDGAEGLRVVRLLLGLLLGLGRLGCGLLRLVLLGVLVSHVPLLGFWVARNVRLSLDFAAGEVVARHECEVQDAGRPSGMTIGGIVLVLLIVVLLVWVF
jgi:hypothetical protein